MGGARLRMGLEEHGGGRQLVRMKITPYVPAAAVAIATVLVTVTLAAALSHSWVAAALIGVMSAALGGAVLWECGVATAWLQRHIESPGT